MKTHNNIIQKSEEWHHVRKGKITGTTLKSIMGTPRAKQEALYETIAERLTVGVEAEMADYESDIDRGNRLEPEAIAAFEFQTGKKVEVVGFCESDDEEFIANSPDGLIGDTEAIEVKCPAGKNYVKAWLTNEIHDDYHWQTVQYFVVNEKLETLYFVVYNPNIALYPMHTIEVKREDIKDDIEKAVVAQKEFLESIDEKLKTIIKL